MSDGLKVSLADHGIRLFSLSLFQHDYLWFSGVEFSKRSETLPILHNYALTYSLGDYSYSLGPGIPTYEEDLARIQVYATPAEARQVGRTQVTYNAMDDRTLRTDAGPSGRNTPDMGHRVYLDPVTSPLGGFTGYLFTLDGRSPKGVTRLGKKGCALRVHSSEIQVPMAVWLEKPARPSHPINPRDVEGDILEYQPVAMPPHLLCRHAVMARDWFVRSGRHLVHIPRRISRRWAS